MNLYPIILDTDPGLDDAIAIALLSAFAKDRLDTVITGYGNVSADKTTQNMLRCCTLFDLSPCLISGSTHPCNLKDYTDASHIHGADGFAGVKIPAAGLPVITEKPIDALYQRICMHDAVDYITIGPLTNLSLLLEKYPDVKRKLHHVYTMGGGLAFGNITSEAEFNFYCDPSSAAQVLAANLPQTIIPLDTTHQIVLSEEDILMLTRTRSRKSGYIQQLLTANYQNNLTQGEKGCILHDASAVIAFLFPDCFQIEKCNLCVDPGTGKMTKETGNTHLITTLADREKIISLLAEALI